eukprot:10979790-Prorocentrum_lima.AAC.1
MADPCPCGIREEFFPRLRTMDSERGKWQAIDEDYLAVAKSVVLPALGEDDDDSLPTKKHTAGFVA